MNKIVFSVVAVVLLSLFSCSRMTPEIVEYDPSYKPKDPTALDKSSVAKPPIDLLTKYVVFVNNDQTILASVVKQEDGSYEAQPIDEAEVGIKLSYKMDKDLTVKITEMTTENQLSTYKTVVAGENQLLPNDMYTLSAREVTFVAGEVEQSITVSFDADKIKSLDQKYNYVLPLVVEIPEDPNLKDHNFCLLTIKLNEMGVIPAGNNVRYDESGVENLTKVPYGNLSVATTYREDVVWRVIDGSTIGNWWVPSNSQETLTLSFEKQMIKGIKISTNEYKDVKTVDIAVSNTGGKDFIPQGRVTNPNPGNMWYGASTVIVFEKAYEIDAIRFSNFVGNRDYVNVTEIELYI